MNKRSRDGWWPLIPSRSERRGFLLLAVIVVVWFTMSWITHSSIRYSNQRIPAPEASYPRLNQASAGRIEEIPGIGLERAKQIVVYRRRNGTISSMSELKNVSGIGPDTIRTLRTYARLQPKEGD